MSEEYTIADLTPDEITAAALRLSEAVVRDIEDRVIAACGVPRDILMPEPTPISVYQTHEGFDQAFRMMRDIWYVGVVKPMTFMALASCVETDSGFGRTPRGSAKSFRAYRNANRAFKRRQPRRGRYWMKVALKWEKK